MINDKLTKGLENNVTCNNGIELDNRDTYLYQQFLAHILICRGFSSTYVSLHKELAVSTVIIVKKCIIYFRTLAINQTMVI